MTPAVDEDAVAKAQQNLDALLVRRAAKDAERKAALDRYREQLAKHVEHPQGRGRVGSGQLLDWS